MSKNKSIIATFVSLFVLLSSVMAFSYIPQAYGADEESKILFDMGNGDTYWYVASEGDTIDEVLEKTAIENGMKYSSIGNTVTLDGKTEVAIGSTDDGGSTTISGTTGIIQNTKWNVFVWNDSTSEWDKAANLSDPYDGGYLALAFYPDDIAPVLTPEYKTAWTMVRGNSEQTGRQDNVTILPDEAEVDWEITRGNESSSVLASPVYVEDRIFIKFAKSGSKIEPVVRCYDFNGNQVWEFEYEGQSAYESTTPVIVGEYIYVPAAEGYVYKMSWREGPGEGNVNVTSFGGSSMEEATALAEVTSELTGRSYNAGPGSLVYDSGAIYFTSGNGMVYCFDLDLKLIWSYQMNGSTYYVSPTIYGDYLFSGAYDGYLYVLDKSTGEKVTSKQIYVDEKGNGNVGAVSVIDQDSKYTLIFSVDQGYGMNTTKGGVGVYDFDLTEKTLTKVEMICDRDTFGLTGNYHLPIVTDDFKGTYFFSTKGFFKMDVDGNYTLLNDSIYPIKSPPMLINDESIYVSSYAPNRPIYELGLDGTIISEWVPDTKIVQYSMSPLVFANGMMFRGNDAGFISISGTLPDYIPPAEGDKFAYETILLLVIVALLILILIYVVLRFGRGIEKPFRYIGQRLNHYVYGEDLKHNTKSKNRLRIMMLIGITITVVVFITCLCVGPTVNLSVGDMFESLTSAISKGGQGLTYDELMVYESRLPRTIAALGVGIGLSVAGSMYQAIIRNPLVDPYIMGVSAGAGTAALAVIAFDFTFFGLFSSHSIYLTAFTAIIGGIVAFAITMLIAEKSGSSSINYVLAGVVVGLAFSAAQTLMLSMAGQKVGNALSWLYGTFSNVTWDQVWLILIPALVLSLVPLIWAKEFNLVLLGEDQAKQMGLDVKWFNRIMLILASVLTSICVAFVGIIGFVGLVIPHVCRMILGSDHRLVLPASITLGGALMMFADLLSRMVYIGFELPVGAITSIIGVPVFAYLLVRRGRMYDG